MGGCNGLRINLRGKIRDILIQNRGGRCTAVCRRCAEVGIFRFGYRNTAAPGCRSSLGPCGFDIQRIGIGRFLGAEIGFKLNRTGGRRSRRSTGIGRTARRHRLRRGYRFSRIKIHHRLKVGRVVAFLGERCAAPQGETHRVALFSSRFRNQQQRPVTAGAEGNAGIRQTQPLQAAAQQIKDLVADGRIVEFRRQGAGRCTVAVADQHKGALSYGGGHVGSGKIGAGYLQRRNGTPCGSLYHIPGKFFQKLLGHLDLALALGIGVAFGAKIKHRFTVRQRLQQIAQQAAGGFIHRHQQLALLQQQVQRSLGQAGLPHCENIIAKLGVEFLYPFVAVLLCHGTVGCADLYADGKFAVPFQQTQTGAAVGTGLPQHGRNFGGCGSKNAQNFELCVDHDVPFFRVVQILLCSGGVSGVTAIPSGTGSPSAMRRSRSSAYRAARARMIPRS